MVVVRMTTVWSLSHWASAGRTEQRRTNDAIVCELDALQKRAKASEAATKTVEQELEAFQVRLTN